MRDLVGAVPIIPVVAVAQHSTARQILIIMARVAPTRQPKLSVPRSSLKTNLGRWGSYSTPPPSSALKSDLSPSLACDLQQLGSTAVGLLQQVICQNISLTHTQPFLSIFTSDGSIISEQSNQQRYPSYSLSLSPP